MDGEFVKKSLVPKDSNF